MDYKTFETERLLLIPTTTKDASFVFELLNTPKWKANIGDRQIHSIEDAEKYITQKMLPQLEKYGYSNYTVIIKETNTKIGSCGLYNREGIDGVDIGFAFLPEFEGYGYAFEAASRVKQAAFQDFSLNKISAITLPSNTSSIKLIEKLGLTFIEKVTIPNDDELLMLFTLNK
ncbi:GNAT family N-acetyltransferase [Corallibacter sp.]|uniref:GNAT family N-acetyltransferase n=1 Tax=Corallibacter sp. TaxID=2038084 RepID=UPI003AB16136